MFSGGIRLGKFFGTEIFLHPLWFLLMFVFVFPSLIDGDFGRAAITALFLVVMYLSVIGHEFAHIFAGRCFGIKTPKIIINFFGGAAMMERIPFGIPESLIGVAGPMFSYLVGMVIVLPLMLLGVPYKENPVLDFYFSIGYMNLILGMFNTFPIFPMDGGRILRGILFHKNKKIVLSTKISMIVGFLTIPIVFLVFIPLNLFSILIMGLIVKMCYDEFSQIKSIYQDLEGASEKETTHVSQGTALLCAFGADSKEVIEFLQSHNSPTLNRVMKERIEVWRLFTPQQKLDLKIEAQKHLEEKE